MGFWSFAEMDTPISNTEAHPYGRRRAGASIGKKKTFLVYIASTFIEIQKYEFN